MKPLEKMILLKVSVAAFLILSSLTFSAQRFCPIKIKFIGHHSGKPPLQWYYLDIEMINQSDKVKYFLLPYNANDTLSANKPLKASEHEGRSNFQGKKYPDSASAKNYIVETVFYGTWDNGCRIFSVPPRSSIHLRDYALDAWSKTDTLFTLEAEAVMVNNKTPLEKWLPFEISSTANSFVEDGRQWMNLNWDPKENKTRQDFRKKKVKDLRLVNAHPYHIPLPKKPCLADSLLQKMNSLHLKGARILTNRKDDLYSEQNIKITDLSNALHNLGIKIKSSQNGYFMGEYFSTKLIDQLNWLVSAAGDTEHTPKGMESTGESIVMFKNLGKTLYAYGIEYDWSEKLKKYVLK